MRLISNTLAFILLTFSSLIQADISQIKSVFVADVRKTELFDLYSYPAKLSSEKQSYLLAPGQGIVEKIYKGVGETVKKNDLILTIKHDDPSYDYKSQKILSPLDGVIAEQLIEEGGKVAIGDRLGLVIDPCKIKITVEITLKDINVIQVGTKGKLRYPESNLETEAIVTQISPMIDPLTGTAQARLKIDNPENFRIGTIGVIDFQIGNREGYELTKDAIIYLGKKTYVRLIDEKNKVVRNEIEIKPRSSATVEVLSGIKDGQKVVIKSSGFLPDGATVKIEKSQN